MQARLILYLKSPKGHLGKGISGVYGLFWAEGFGDHLSVCHEGAMGQTLIESSIIHLHINRRPKKEIHSADKHLIVCKLFKDKVLNIIIIHTSNNLAITAKWLEDRTSQLSMLFIIVPGKGEVSQVIVSNNISLWEDSFSDITVTGRLETLTLKVDIAHVENGSE